MKERISRAGSLEAALDEVKAVYRELGTRPAERDCRLRTDCCRFQDNGKVPYLTRGEAIVAARAWRVAGRKRLPGGDDGACPLLAVRTGRCLVYEARPFACRTHFCQEAGGTLPRRDVLDLIRRLEQVDTALGGDGARTLPAALTEALRSLDEPW